MCVIFTAFNITKAIITILYISSALFIWSIEAISFCTPITFVSPAERSFVAKSPLIYATTKVAWWVFAVKIHVEIAFHFISFYFRSTVQNFLWLIFTYVFMTNIFTWASINVCVHSLVDFCISLDRALVRIVAFFNETSQILFSLRFDGWIGVALTIIINFIFQVSVLAFTFKLSID